MPLRFAKKPEGFYYVEVICLISDIERGTSVSQTKQPRSGRLSGNPLPGILSALVVIAILIGLGVMLANRASMFDAQMASTVPTSEAVVTEGDTNMAYTAAPPMTIDPQKTYFATITTPRGDIRIKLLPDLAPETVNNFVFLARQGFYDGLSWHRVIKDFMAQGGDPDGTGSGGPGYTIRDEFTNQMMFDRPGIVAMARPSAPDSAGSQFFITTAAAPWLNEQYTIFGEVVEGQEIVNAIPLRDPATARTPGEQIITIAITEEG